MRSSKASIKQHDLPLDAESGTARRCLVFGQPIAVDQPPRWVRDGFEIVACSRCGLLQRESLSGIPSFSGMPPRTASWLAPAILVIAFLAITVIATLRVTGSYIPGFATTYITVLLVGGLQQAHPRGCH